MLGFGFRRVLGQFQAGGVAMARQLAWIGQAQMIVHRRLARHGDGAGGHLDDGGVAVVGRRHRRLAPAHQHAQPDLQPFGAFGLFQRAGPHVDADGPPVDGQRVGLVGPGTARGIDQRLGQALKAKGVGGVGHAGLTGERIRPGRMPRPAVKGCGSLDLLAVGKDRATLAELDLGLQLVGVALDRAGEHRHHHAWTHQLLLRHDAHRD